MTQKLYKCLCIFVLPWLFMFFDTLHFHWTAPFDKLVPMLILIEVTTPLTEHHAVFLFMFKPRPSTQSLLIRLSFLLESSTAGSSLFDTLWSSLSNGVTAEEVAAEHLMNLNFPDSLFSLLSHLHVLQSMFARRPSSWLMTLVIAKNHARKREFSC